MSSALKDVGSIAQPTKDKWISCPSHFFIFLLSLCTVNSLIKGITLKIRMLCFVITNSVILNLVYVFGSCFRTVAVILVSDFSSQYVGCSKQKWA